MFLILKGVVPTNLIRERLEMKPIELEVVAPMLCPMEMSCRCKRGQTMQLIR